MRPLARRGPFTLTWPVLAFVALTALAIAPFVDDWPNWPRSFASDPVGFASWLVSVLVPRLAVPLVGAALFLRHPDAHRRLPLLVMGAGLLAVEPLVARGVRWLVDAVIIGTRPEDLTFAPLDALAALLAGLIGVFGAAYLGRGLSEARQHEDRGPVRWLVAVVFGAAIAWGALTAVTAASLPVADDPLVRAVVSGLWVVGAVAGVLAGGYLAVAATRGALAGERGRRAWVLASVGLWGILLAQLAMGALSYGWAVPGLASELTSAAYQVLALVSSAAHVLVLLAFLDGLPDDEAITWFDLPDLDAAVAASGPAPDPFADDVDDGAGPTTFDLEDRRLDQ